MIGAVIQNGTVQNLIVIAPAQVAELEKSGVRVLDAEPLDVEVGDTWDGVDFFRDRQKLPIPLSIYPPADNTLEDAMSALNVLGVGTTEGGATNGKAV